MRTLATLLFLTMGLAVQAEPLSALSLHYEAPAVYFEESLVIGNGNLGAIIYGGCEEERISLNDITLWSGEPDTAVYTPEAHKYIREIRELLFAEKYREANSLDKKVQGHYSQNYQPLGTLSMRSLEQDDVSSYRRSLDLETAMVRIGYKTKSGEVCREAFASAPDSVIVYRWVAGNQELINRSIRFHSMLETQAQASVLEDSTGKRSSFFRVLRHDRGPVGSRGELCIDGYCSFTSMPSYITKDKSGRSSDPERGIHFRTLIRVVTDGKVEAPYVDELQVRDAHELTLYITNVTSFNGAHKNPVTEGREYQQSAINRIDSAVAKGYDLLRQRHQEDYQSLFSRISLDLGKTSAELAALPTDQQLKLYSQPDTAPNPDLEELYFQYGRYLLIASSRTPNVPANLQGLWNEYITPPWSSNYTSNINVEENYWPALTGNLSEMDESLMGFIAQLPATGEASAKAYYGVQEGWNLGQNTDIWAMTCPVGQQKGDPSWACWTMGGAWLATHIWEHYAFTMDRNFLSEMFPVLKGAADFCIGWLVEKDGYLLTAPGTSPENKYKLTDGYVGSVLYGATADIAIIRECLTDALLAAKILDYDSGYQTKLQKTIDRLLPYRIGAKGNLQEWYHDWEDQDPQHRHQSHLFGLFPGHQISLDKTPELAKACAKTLEIKGDNTTGWSTGWRVNLFARLHDGEAAYRIYHRLLSYVSPDEYNGPDRVHRGGTYPNLFDAHPPFQIDGNFGGTAGVIEMLVQSSLEGGVVLLPALPEAWKAAGSLKGVRVRGGFEISFSWKDGRINSLSVKSLRSDKGKLRLRQGNNTWTVSLKPGAERKLQ